MFEHFFGNREMRRILVYLGAAGTVALIGGGIYAASISAVTPTNSRFIEDLSAPEDLVLTDVTPEPSGTQVRINKEVVRVTIADTPAKREQGLSGRRSLAKDEGMLFAFDSDGQYGIWMKGMLFAVDIIWIASDGAIVHIVEGAAPESYPQAFIPPRPARYVLELPADWVRSHDVSIGDHVAL